MAKRLNITGQARGGPLGVQTVLRLMTILIVIIGVAYLGPIYYKRIFHAKPEPAPGTGAPTGTVLPRLAADNDAGEVTYDIDLRHFPLPKSADNAPVSAASDDNASEVAAIVGLDAIQDGAAIERQPLYYLLREVETRRSADDLFMKRAPVVTLAELRADPDKFRCKPVTVRGKIIRLESSTLPENPSGIREVMEGDLLVGREGICMFLCSRRVSLRINQEVAIHGLFMQLVRYAAAGGRQEDAALVITSHPSILGAARGKRMPVSLNTLIGILVMLFIVYFVMMLILRRRQQSRRTLFEVRRKARQLTSGASEDGEPQGTEEP